MSKRLIGVGLVPTCIVLLVVAAMAQTQPAVTERTTPSGMKIIEIKKTDAPLRAEVGDIVWVHYTGKLTDGTVVDSSLSGDRKDRVGDNIPIKFHLGAGDVIRGWDEGVAGMAVGEKRHLSIPPSLAYGSEPRGPIPADSTLEFDVQLVGIYRIDK